LFFCLIQAVHHGQAGMVYKAKSFLDATPAGADVSGAARDFPVGCIIFRFERRLASLCVFNT
jgi:hypothetical protein